MDAQAMTTWDAVLLSQIPPALGVGIWLVAGMLVGAFHFLTLRWCVTKFVAAPPLLLPLGLQLMRFALIAAVLAAITTAFGALPLLTVTAGIVIMRTIIMPLDAPS
jgi:F1F0 ATPase subunit 2